MEIEHVPLLKIARELYRTPRGFTRFREYIATLGTDPEEMPLPLTVMNPMAHPHVADALDALLANGADGIAALACAEAARRIDGEPPLRCGLVVADDVMGGWTNRYLTDFNFRFGKVTQAGINWAITILWVGESYDGARVREQTLVSIYRSLYRRRNGRARSLADQMLQEGLAHHFAGAREPALEADDLAYSREVIAPIVGADGQPVQLAALFGDTAAREVGYDPLGLSTWAGIAVALDDARRRDVTPEAALTAPRA